MNETRYNIVLHDDNDDCALVLTNLTHQEYDIILELDRLGWLQGCVKMDENVIIYKR